MRGTMLFTRPSMQVWSATTSDGKPSLIGARHRGYEKAAASESVRHYRLRLDAVHAMTRERRLGCVSWPGVAQLTSEE